jgi:hypothetical protein
MRIRDSILGVDAAQHEISQHDRYQPALGHRPPIHNDIANIGSPTSPPQEQPHAVTDMSQPPVRPGIQAGGGRDGYICADANGIIMSGCYATGASMSLRDVQNFTGIVDRGAGLGASLST